MTPAHALALTALRTYWQLAVFGSIALAPLAVSVCSGVALTASVDSLALALAYGSYCSLDLLAEFSSYCTSGLVALKTALRS